MGENRCRVSFQWTIGEIDDRFRITRDDVKRIMEEAIQLWEGALDEFETQYDEHRGIRLKFVYDERQELSNNERQFQERVHASRVEVETLETEYEQLVVQFEQRSEEFRRLSEEIERRVESLNSWIREKNDAGGLREDDVSRLETEKGVIDQLQRNEHSMQQDLNAFGGKIDELRERLNRTIDENNQMIEFYNREYAKENQFTSGRYEHAAGIKSITIYHFASEMELRLVLAHELGHALGLDHVPNPASIMHKTMREQLQQQTLALTSQDREAIQMLCNERLGQ